MNSPGILGLAWRVCLMAAIAIAPAPPALAGAHHGQDTQASEPARDHHPMTNDGGGCHDATGHDEGAAAPGQPDPPQRQHDTSPCVSHCLAMAALPIQGAWSTMVISQAAVSGRLSNPLVDPVRDVDLRPPIG